MPVIPAGIPTCVVQGSLHTLIADTSTDADTNPDSIDLTGATVIVTPNLPSRVVQHAASKSSIIIADAELKVLASGVLQPKSASPAVVTTSGPNATSYSSFEVVAAAADGLLPRGWTYRLNITIPSIKLRTAFDFGAPAGTHALADLAVLPENGDAVMNFGDALAQAFAAAANATEAANAGIVSVNGARDAAVTAVTTARTAAVAEVNARISAVDSVIANAQTVSTHLEAATAHEASAATAVRAAESARDAAVAARGGAEAAASAATTKAAEAAASAATAAEHAVAGAAQRGRGVFAYAWSNSMPPAQVKPVTSYDAATADHMRPLVGDVESFTAQVGQPGYPSLIAATAVVTASAPASVSRTVTSSSPFSVYLPITTGSGITLAGGVTIAGDSAGATIATIKNTLVIDPAQNVAGGFTPLLVVAPGATPPTFIVTAASGVTPSGTAVKRTTAQGYEIVGIQWTGVAAATATEGGVTGIVIASGRKLVDGNPAACIPTGWCLANVARTTG